MCIKTLPRVFIYCKRLYLESLYIVKYILQYILKYICNSKKKIIYFGQIVLMLTMCVLLDTHTLKNTQGLWITTEFRRWSETLTRRINIRARDKRIISYWFSVPLHPSRVPWYSCSQLNSCQYPQLSYHMPSRYNQWTFQPLSHLISQFLSLLWIATELFEYMAL